MKNGINEMKTIYTLCFLISVCNRSHTLILLKCCSTIVFVLHCIHFERHQWERKTCCYLKIYFLFMKVPSFTRSILIMSIYCYLPSISTSTPSPTPHHVFFIFLLLMALRPDSFINIPIYTWVYGLSSWA